MTDTRPPASGSPAPSLASNNKVARGSDRRFLVCNAKSDNRSRGAPSGSKATITNDAYGKPLPSSRVASDALRPRRTISRAAWAAVGSRRATVGFIGTILIHRHHRSAFSPQSCLFCKVRHTGKTGQIAGIAACPAHLPRLFSWGSAKRVKSPAATFDTRSNHKARRQQVINRAVWQGERRP